MKYPPFGYGPDSMISNEIIKNLKYPLRVETGSVFRSDVNFVEIKKSVFSTHTKNHKTLTSTNSKPKFYYTKLYFGNFWLNKISTSPKLH